MSPTLQELTAAVLAPSTQIYRRIQIFESDNVTPWGPGDRLIEGSVSVDYGRDERRSMDCSLANWDAVLRKTPGGFWYDKVLRAYYGFDVRTSQGTVRHEELLGTFLADRISESSGSATVRVTARDFTKKMIQSKFRQATTFPAGTYVETLIRTLASNSGITSYVTPAPSKQTTKDFTFEAEATRWQAAKEVATAYNYEIFFDPSGNLVLREFLDPVSSPLSFSFTTGPGGSLASYEKTGNDTRLFNHIVVTGDTGDDTLPFIAEAVNTEPSSPTNVDEIDHRYLFHNSSFITSQAQADALALSLLRINALEEFDLNVEALAIPWLSAGEIVGIVTPKDAPGDPTRFLLSSLTLPLGLGAMSANGKRVSVVG